MTNQQISNNSSQKPANLRESLDGVTKLSPRLEQKSLDGITNLKPQIPQQSTQTQHNSKTDSSNTTKN